MCVCGLVITVVSNKVGTSVGIQRHYTLLNRGLYRGASVGDIKGILRGY